MSAAGLPSSTFVLFRLCVVLAAGGCAIVSTGADIRFDAAQKTWRLTSGDVEYRLRRQDDHVWLDYFGPMDRPVWRPNAAGTWPGAASGYSEIAGRINGAALTPNDLRLVSDGTRSLRPGVEALQLTLKHERLPVELAVVYAAWGDTGVFTRQVTVVNRGEQSLEIESLPSLGWRLPGGPYALDYLWGGWGRERQLASERLGAGRREFVNRRGRSSHGYSPWFSVWNPRLGTRVLAQLAWSGNWQMAFERLPTARPVEEEELNVELGMRFDQGGALRLPPGASFEMPVVAFTASSGDLDDAANRLHRYQREFVVPRTPANEPPLVQFNSWYPFPGKMTAAEMKRCADVAASLGAEVFVLDAGWFNKTNWDRELGDWEADPVAFPNGLEELSRFVHAKDMKFGLWLEIENVGVDSQMRREHGDWCLTFQGQPVTQNLRSQLNFGRPEVRAWAREVIDRLVRDVRIDWVKLDYNIDIGEQFDPSGATGTGDALYRHITGYYAWLDEIRAAYPSLVIENCSSGGLRFDLGLLGHTHTTWLSDEVLPWPSLQLAYGATIEFTPGVCNHWMVGETPNGRVDPNGPPGWWDFLFRVPMNGQFGLSSRVFEWSPELQERAQQNIALYKRIRSVLVDAEVYHLTPPPAHDQPTNWMALQYVSPDRNRSVLLVYRLAQSPNDLGLRLRGLPGDRRYQIRENGQSRAILSGAQLAHDGLRVALDAEWRASVFELDATTETHRIPVNGQTAGRVFEGIGALSAGASSRLLVDYGEPYRSQVLDFLFKPRFGAGFQHLKVEVGGDVNSTDGCEPSHMRTRTDENYERGYEWWLMKEAKRRNPQIILDCLQWGAPAWIGNGHFYSQDNADFLVRFLRGARDVHGLDIQYAGVWNETRYDTGWIKLFRRTLDEHGLQRVGIVAADEINQWSIVDVMQTDAELANAVQVVGSHYPKYQSPAAAQRCGKRIWSSEDGPWKGTWEGAVALAKAYNRNYSEGRMTKTIIWSPVTAYYDNLPLPGSGVMTANSPWSGHYRVQPALWATAHTTQFAEPGWRYLEGGGCGFLPNGGSHVALRATNHTDYSVIVETLDARAPQTVTFEIAGGLAVTPVHVWHSSADEQFVPLPDVTPQNARFTVTLEGGCIYSLTTTTGQTRGQSQAAPERGFPLPYREDFEGYARGSTPRYFSDQAGIFEVVKRQEGQGNCLRQVIDRKGIEWHFHWNPAPETVLGDLEWRDYEVAVEARLESEGFISLFGRVGKVPQNENLPDAYWLKVADTGAWELGTAKVPLASGRVPFRRGAWHQLKLQFLGPTIRVVIDGVQVGGGRDATYPAGMVGLGSGWHGAEFDNLSVLPLPAAY